MSLSTNFSRLRIRPYIITAQSKIEQTFWIKSNKWEIKQSEIAKEINITILQTNMLQISAANEITLGEFSLIQKHSANSFKEHS